MEIKITPDNCCLLGERRPNISIITEANDPFAQQAEYILNISKTTAERWGQTGLNSGINGKQRKK